MCAYVIHAHMVLLQEGTSSEALNHAQNYSACFGMIRNVGVQL